ncbi:IucA/IucC family protein [Agrobacterium sp. rho-13.3]|uniref:IucA/IucC family protein n=1 Tax=Agrobacterium sp. rho-13.3 TaxID=3072980 RepID=UPI002A11FE51|nr:IucA/IucC family protein [Agrobacterium sp. rho-13.3]MDX8308393.1 IucA/IucC family protein [Agrobacterium sp. rho-13.3]
MSVAWRTAETATFRSFANCYMREIDAGKAVCHEVFGRKIDCVEWVLHGERMLVRAEVTSASLCGPHHFGRIWKRALSEASWHDCPTMPALQALMREAYRHQSAPENSNSDGCETELLLRVMDSNQQIKLNIERALEKPDDSDDFIAAEQSLFFGHWLHPTPKSRQGMTFWQQETYAPEFHGRFQLHYFAARTDFVTHASATKQSADRIIASLVGPNAGNFSIKDNESLLPMHPLQAQALLLDPDIGAMMAEGTVRTLGPAGAHFTATSSVRTVWNDNVDWMLKFSLPVRITNSVRSNGRDELDAGVAMARLIDRLDLARQMPSFRIIRDPAFITLDLPGRKESGFETIFRENPFRAKGGMGVITLAALTAEPLPGQLSRLERIVRQVHANESGNIASTTASWFRHYLICTVAPLIELYDRHGIALEAHQQNSLVDISTGYPRLGYYRDNQGFYLSERHRPTIARVVPETETIDSLYFPEADIRDRFAYYLIVNQVFSVISRMAHDGLMDEMELLRILREYLEHLALGLNGLGRDFIRHILDEGDIGTKANLATRLANLDELTSGGGHSLYRKMPNPLSLAPITSIDMERPHAIAS